MPISENELRELEELKELEELEQLESIDNGRHPMELKTIEDNKIRQDKAMIEQKKFSESLSLSESLFPRTSRSRGVLKTIGSATMDLLSLPGRGLVAGSMFMENEAPIPYPELKKAEYKPTFKERLHKTEGQGLFGDILTDPATIPSVAIPAVAAARWIKPAATFGKKALQAMGVGAGEGALSSLIHQTDNVVQGGKINPIDAAIETSISTLLPGVTSSMGEAAKAAGRKILKTAIKPSKKLTQRSGSKFDIQTIFDEGLDSKLGFSRMQKKMNSYGDEISEQYKPILDNAKEEINMTAALRRAKIKINKEIAAGNHSESIAGINKGFDQWKGYLKSQGGTVDLKTALNRRKGLGKLAKYDKIDPKSIKGEDTVAREFRNELNNIIDGKYPDVRELDGYLAKLYPVREALEDAIHRTDKSSFISLGESMALGAGLVGGGVTHEQKGIGLLPGLILAATIRGGKSPGAASAIYRTGQGNFATTGIKMATTRTTGTKFGRDIDRDKEEEDK